MEPTRVSATKAKWKVRSSTGFRSNTTFNRWPDMENNIRSQFEQSLFRKWGGSEYVKLYWNVNSISRQSQAEWRPITDNQCRYLLCVVAESCRSRLPTSVNYWAWRTEFITCVHRWIVQLDNGVHLLSSLPRYRIIPSHTHLACTCRQMLPSFRIFQNY